MEYPLPDLFFRPSAKSSGCSKGSRMVSNISALAVARPPTSLQETLGILGVPKFSVYDTLDFFRARSKSRDVKGMTAAAAPVSEMEL